MCTDRRSTLIRSCALAAALVGMMLVAIATTAPTYAAAQSSEPHQAQPHSHAPRDEAAPAEKEHEAGWLPTIAKTFNFALLVGVLVYFLKDPLTAYLSSRITRVREDLVTAAATREAAMRHLAEIDARLKTLPGELEELKRRGSEDIVEERARIEQAAEAERLRLLEHTRREIDMRLRVARRQLVEFTATLAVKVASERISRSITPDDQMRLVDRYTTQLQGAQQ
jgi:F-type H+-transporting ATPase subunit b